VFTLNNCEDTPFLVKKILCAYLNRYASRTADAQTEDTRSSSLFDSSSISSSSPPFDENFSQYHPKRSSRGNSRIFNGVFQRTTRNVRSIE